MTATARAHPPAQESAGCGNNDVSKTPLQAATSYAGTFSGRAEEAARVRREIAAYLDDCPAAGPVMGQLAEGEQGAVLDVAVADLAT
jgi:hypothetical protein